MLFSGVADGVGGWREYGVDPSQVPRTIMSLCSRLVENGKFSASSPEEVLEQAYEEASMHKDAAMGKMIVPSYRKNITYNYYSQQ